MKKCFIVIDYQSDFVLGSLGFLAARDIEDGIIEKIRQYRAEGGQVIFTLDTHFEDYLSTLEGRRLPVAHCIKGTFGHELYGRVKAAVQQGDLVFEKHTFGSGDLYEHLKTVKYDTIEIAGVVTEICVLSNAVLARTAQPDTVICVDALLTATANEDAKREALVALKNIQIDILNEESNR